MKEAQLAILESEAKVKQMIHAEQAVTAARIDVLNRHHQDALAREQQDNDTVQEDISLSHKEELANVTTITICKQQETIDELRDEVWLKRSEVKDLKLDMKTALQSAAADLEAMRANHWKEKRILFKKQKAIKKCTRRVSKQRKT
mmetsp:Transcript_18506/g.38802  ORF Transcript_18506/g.38802 Transcript_18506/m.38802 type:complete len:145 (-) Transcript_18506:263-697(-)